MKKLNVYYPSHVNVRMLGAFVHFKEAARAQKSNRLGCEHDFCMLLSVPNVCLGARTPVMRIFDENEI